MLYLCLEAKRKERMNARIRTEVMFLEPSSHGECSRLHLSVMGSVTDVLCDYPLGDGTGVSGHCTRMEGGIFRPELSWRTPEVAAYMYAV